MIERLDELTMAQYIDIACGDYALIDWDGKKAAELIGEFEKISNPIRFAAALRERESNVKKKMKVLLYSVLLNLLALDADDKVREVLVEIGKGEYKDVDKEVLQKKLKQWLRTDKAAMEREAFMKEKERKESGVEERGPKQIRADFFTEVAVLMRHFKMPIDVHSINAEVYANLRRQAEEEVKAMAVRRKK